MSENSERLATENTFMQTNAPDSVISVVHAQQQVPTDETQGWDTAPQKALPREVETPLPPSATSVMGTKETPNNGSSQERDGMKALEPSQDSSSLGQADHSPATSAVPTQEIPRAVETPPSLPATSVVPIQETPKRGGPEPSQDSSGLGQADHSQKSYHPKKNLPVRVNKRAVESSRLLTDQCRQLCLSLFFRELDPVRSLGFTSSIGGEGKSFLALITAGVLAHDSINPVILVECNWEHPVLHEYFGIPATPGLAEWVRGTCDVKHISYQVERNLTVIPAGDGAQDAVKLLKRVQQHGLLKLFGHANVIVDLPPIITTGYGTLAAGLPESIVVVVRSQLTPDSMVGETCARLKEVPIHGIILNQEESRIPQWIRQLL